jgi:hypothetical protein
MSTKPVPPKEELTDEQKRLIEERIAMAEKEKGVPLRKSIKEGRAKLDAVPR